MTIHKQKNGIALEGRLDTVITPELEKNEVISGRRH